jgi:hypothetical protein
MVLNNPVHWVDILGLRECRTELYFGHAELPGDPPTPRNLSQPEQVERWKQKIKSNDDSYKEDLSEYREKLKRLSPNITIFPRAPINENWCSRYGTGGCNPDHANKNIPSQYRVIDPNILMNLTDENGNKIYNKDGTVNITEANVTAIITSMLHQARDAAQSACNSDNKCECTSFRITLTCDEVNEQFMGSGNEIRGGGSANLGAFDKFGRCGKSWTASCKKGQPMSWK